MSESMTIPLSPLPEPLEAGLFLSRGQSRHPTRIIDSHELIFVRSGRLGMFEENEKFDLRPGQTLLLRAGHRHGGTADYPPDLSFYWVHFRLPPLARSRKRMLLPRTATLSRPEVLTEYLRRYLDEREEGLNTVTGGALLLLMFREVARASEQSSARGAGMVLAERAWRYIVAHAHEPISTADVARRLRCNPDYLGRVFRAARGCSLVQAIHRRRIHEAKALLLEGEESVEEIARRCGFSEACYFRRVFRRVEGLSPRTFRRLYSRVHVNVR